MALEIFGGMLPWKFFETLDTVMGILVLFEQLFYGKFFGSFLPLTLRASSNMVHFVRTFSTYACLRCKAGVSKVRPAGQLRPAMSFHTARPCGRTICYFWPTELQTHIKLIIILIQLASFFFDSE